MEEDADAREGIFWREALPGLPVPVFRALIPVGFSKQNVCGFSWAAGRPQAASLPHRSEMGILAHFPWGVRILLRKTPPESKHGKQEQAVPAAPSAKKFLPLLGAVMCDLYVWFYNKKAKGSFAFCFFCYHTLGVRKNSGCPVCDWEMVF